MKQFIRRNMTAGTFHQQARSHGGVTGVVHPPPLAVVNMFYQVKDAS